jgi:hypothetical protein
MEVVHLKGVWRSLIAKRKLEAICIGTEDRHEKASQQGCGDTVAIGAMPLSRFLKKECCQMKDHPSRT